MKIKITVVIMISLLISGCAAYPLYNRYGYGGYGYCGYAYGTPKYVGDVDGWGYGCDCGGGIHDSGSYDLR